MAIRIEKDVPLPGPETPLSLSEQLMQSMCKMEVGDSFRLEGPKHCRLAQETVDVANTAGTVAGSTMHGKQFVIRLYNEIEYRLFHPCDYVQTCRVWRVA